MKAHTQISSHKYYNVIQKILTYDDVFTYLLTQQSLSNTKLLKCALYEYMTNNVDFSTKYKINSTTLREEMYYFTFGGRVVKNSQFTNFTIIWRKDKMNSNQ